MPVTIAVPKGRLGDEAYALLKDCGIVQKDIPKDSRKLIFSVGNSIDVILLRAWDVPTYVESGTADIGICGRDDCLEHDADVLMLYDLGFGECSMAVAAPGSMTCEELFSRSYLKVATKYPNIAGKFFSSISVQAEIIKLYGSVELAAVTGMSDCIVDIVSTGLTLKENGLCVIETLFRSSAGLIANRASFYRNPEFMSSLTSAVAARLKK